MKNLYKNIFKRWFDVSFSLICLILFSPIILVTAVLIKLKLGSPILYVQQRPGKNEKTFKLYKFRTMLPELDVNNQPVAKKNRLTSFGKLLRSASLDELPELYNILKGDMSFVGPRPLLMHYLPYYTLEEKQRHNVRPGLTGLAQINGRNNLSWEDRFYYDIYYSKHISFKGDMQILFKTVRKVIHQSDISHFEAELYPDFDVYRIQTNIDNSK